ncbi:hypothetical protein [Taibaiella soli]|uniref:DUF4870 domain-containing protein n=1 Tax=Taibaiella soli TaxID=1649169 RepID=A0A2W2ABS1_9BACT|nr:hypothetical protein [Taibaiella soli]PZF71072.1 hypothetical protein DN068_20455 [Taibaiella soli]
MESDENAYLGSPDNPRTAALVSYITMLGWLTAYFLLYRGSRNSFSAFHLRQTLLLHILAFFLNILSLLALWHYIPNSVVIILAVLLLILWMMGAWSAINNEQKPVPLVGRLAQNLFRNL